ncbi:MAG: ABC transporter substrate-binding protein [Propionibacteriaceae bacterium]|jgi:ABC-type oligopeptide transport system substrate-binding subunit|nr:ABC transporter substrate-binding protein [Propionibacteriaceae bacterium]
MSTRHTRRLVVLVASGLALALAACGSTDTSNDPSATAGAGLVSIAGTVPEGPFYPADITESNREVIARNIFDGLVRVDTDGAVVFEVAESIKTDDAVHFTVTIKQGQLFANGETVTAASFVDAWNWGAYGPNAQKSASNYAPIKGYDAVHPVQEGAEPAAQTLSGLAVVDERTFTIELTAPTISFIGQLTDGVFVPLPQAFFDDPASFADRPIGNGPYQLRDKIDISDGAYLDPNPNYTGTRQPRNDGLYIRFYTSLDTVYQDVLGDNLDIGSASGGGLLTAAADFGDRFVVGPGGPTQTLAFPLWDDFWGSEAGLKVRQAISHSIDRQAIIDTIFIGLAAPARDFTQQGLDGWSDAIPGVDVLDFDPALARRLLAEAGGYPRETLTIYYNADGSHRNGSRRSPTKYARTSASTPCPAPSRPSPSCWD